MELKDVMGQVLNKPNSLLDHASFVQAFMSMATDPGDLAHFDKLHDVTMQLGRVQDFEYFRKLRPYPEMAKMIEQRYMGPRYQLEDLKDYNPGTLGYAYYHHMIDNSFYLHDFTVFEIPDDLTYVKLRETQTHDIWHVVTGYKPNRLGELALQAFYHGQNPMPFQTLIMTAMVLHFATVQPNLLELALEGMFEGWQHGRAAHPLLPVRWEEMWNQSLEDIRQRYNILPLTVL